MLENITHFVFDFDGTLIDSIPLWERIHGMVFTTLNLPYDQHQHFLDIQGMSQTDVCKFITSKYALQTPWTAIDALFDGFALEFFSTVKFLPKAEEFLNKLLETNKKFGIASACRKHIILSYLAGFPKILENCEVVTCDEVGASKPNPAVFLECMKRIGGVLGGSVVFEDTVAGMKGGRASGMRVIGVLSDKGQLEEKEGICDFLIDDYSGIIGEVE